MPADVVPDRPIPATLSHIIRRALEKEPAKRFSTAEQFEQALGASYGDIERERELRASGRRSSSSVMTDRRYVPHAIAGAVALLAVLGAVGIALLPDGDSPEVEILPPTSPPPTTPVVVATRRVLVDSAPTGAQIWRGTEQIGTTPMTFDWVPGQPSALELRLDRHIPARLDLATAHDREIVPLLEMPVAPPTTTAVPPDPVTPRGPRGPRGPRDEVETTMVATTLTMATPPTTSGGGYERFE